MLPIETAFKIYSGLDGNPLDIGYVYFGQVNQNPITSPVTVYWDAAGTQPAAQPLRVQNGYIVRNGTPANVFYSGSYSQLLQDKHRRQVYFSRNSDDYSIATIVQNFINSLTVSSGSSVIGFIQDGTGAAARNLQDKGRESVTTKDFGATGDGVTDDSVAVQKAVNYCLSVYPPAVLEVVGNCVVSSINIDRLVDASQNNTYFRIRGKGAKSGFRKVGAGVMFTSTLVDATAPVSQMIDWDGLTFEGANAADAAYVIDGNKFLRVVFGANCSFNKIKFAKSTIYMQEVSVEGGNARNYSGIWWESTDGAYDCRINMAKFQFGGPVVSWTNPAGTHATAGCSITNTLVQSITGGDAITCDNMRGCGFDEIYFEGNTGKCLNFKTAANLAGTSPNLGVNRGPCYFALTPGQIADPTYFAIEWGNTSAGKSGGGWSNGQMHGIHASTRIAVDNDYDLGATWLGFRTTGNQSVSSAGFTFQTGAVALPTIGSGYGTATANDGLTFIGYGAVRDFTWLNRSGNQVMGINTNGLDVDFSGAVKTSAGAVALPSAGKGTFQATAADGALIIGNGSARDYTVLNKAGNTIMSAPTGTVNLEFGGTISVNSSTMIKTRVNFGNGAAASGGTLTNAPAAGNPTKWIPIDDNGTTRYIPAW